MLPPDFGPPTTEPRPERRCIECGDRSPKAIIKQRVRWTDGDAQPTIVTEAHGLARRDLRHLDRDPYPAAAKPFANWILTREGQGILAGSLPTNSARLDVPPFEADGVGTPSADYYEPDREANAQHNTSTRAFIASLPGGITLSS